MGKRLGCLLLLALFSAFGFAVRFASLGLPHNVSKYGGSALWAASIFWLVSMLLPQTFIPRRATIALLIAFAVEFFKLVRTPALDTFRLTLPASCCSAASSPCATCWPTPSASPSLPLSITPSGRNRQCLYDRGTSFPWRLPDDA